MFRMLKLNPPNGWRAVVWELAIVTLGVLIALAVQQWAEALGSLRKVAGVIKRNPGIAAFGDRGEVEDGQGDHGWHMGSDATLCHAPSASGDV